MGIADFMFSTRQQRMLGPLLLNPGKSFGTLELIRLSGEGVGAGQAQVRKLLDAGVVKSFAMGNQRRIEINPDFPLYPELRSICLKSFGLADAIAETLRQLGEGIQQAFVFGSFAQGSDRVDSDIDLMVIGTADLMALNELIYQLEQRLGRAIHINKHSPEEWAALQGDPVIQHILSEPRIQVLP